MKVRNITVSVDERTHRQARIRAAELDTSVSALVREFLNRLAGHAEEKTGVPAPDPESALDRRRRLLAEIFADFDARGIGLQMSENIPRDALYDRGNAGQRLQPGNPSIPAS